MDPLNAPLLLSLPPELLTMIVRRVAVPGSAQLLELGLACRALLPAVVPHFCREVFLGQCPVGPLRALARAHATPLLFESVRSLKFSMLEGAGVEQKEAAVCAARILRKCRQLRDLFYGIKAPLEWGLVRESCLVSLELNVVDKSMVRGISAKTRLPPTLRVIIITTSLGRRSYSLGAVWDLIDRHADQLDEWWLLPFDDGDFSLSAYPRAIRKLGVVYTFSINQRLLAHLVSLPDFRPRELRLCDPDRATWDALVRLDSLRELWLVDDSTRCLGWGLPPGVKKLVLERAWPGIPLSEHEAARSAVRGVDVVFVITVGSAGVPAYRAEGWRMLSTYEWRTLWQRMDNVRAVMRMKQFIGWSSRPQWILDREEYFPGGPLDIVDG